MARDGESMARAMWDDLRAACRLLTRLPIPSGDGPPSRPGWWGFPLVGALVGLIGGIAGEAACAVTRQAPVAALVALAMTALVTGVLHEDGLADTADGLGGGRTREQKLAIMRDSRIGTYGALTLLLVTGLRGAGLGRAAEHGHQLIGVLVAGHALARTVLPVLAAGLPQARSDGQAASVGPAPPAEAAVAVLIGLGIAVLAVGAARALGLLVAAAIVALVTMIVAGRQVGGITGDIMGAAEQGAEAASFIMAA